MKNFTPLFLLLLLLGCHQGPIAPSGPILDVPLLIGKTQSEIEKQLGASATKSWHKDGTKLTAQFSQSGLLSGFLLECDEPLKDEKRDEFLQHSHLKEGDARYQLSFVEAPDKVFYFSGVQVQLSSTHEVELRVEGPEVLVNVSANGEEFMTMPPWDNSEKKLIINLGQQIVLSASLCPTKNTPPNQPLKVQIVVDGRILKEVSKPYEARCEIVL